MTDLLSRPGYRHLSVVRESNLHPDWCMSTIGGFCGDTHASEWDAVAATGGGFRYRQSDYAEFPVATVRTVLDGDTRSVAFQVDTPLIDPRTSYRPNSGWVHLPISDVYALAAALVEAPTYSAHIATEDGIVIVAVCRIGDIVRVAVTARGKPVSADFRPDEARRLAEALESRAAQAVAPVTWVAGR